MEIKLRKWTSEDVNDLAKIANCKEIAENLEDNFPQPYKKKDAELYIKMTSVADPKVIVMFAIELDGKAIGSISVIKCDEHNTNSAKIGFWLGKKYWNKGLMTQAIKLATDRAFDHFSVMRISATVFNNNTPARVALENAGYSWEGTLRKAVVKNGEYHDAIIYGITK